MEPRRVGHLLLAIRHILIKCTSISLLCPSAKKGRLHVEMKQLFISLCSIGCFGSSSSHSSFVGSSPMKDTELRQLHEEGECFILTCRDSDLISSSSNCVKVFDCVWAETARGPSFTSGPGRGTSSAAFYHRQLNTGTQSGQKTDFVMHFWTFKKKNKEETLSLLLIRGKPGGCSVLMLQWCLCRSMNGVKTPLGSNQEGRLTRYMRHSNLIPRKEPVQLQEARC